MAMTSSAWLRWLALVPFGLTATAIVQIGATAVFEFVLGQTVGYEPWTTWLARSIAAVIMGAVFVISVWWLAPHSKLLVASAALGIVMLWSLWLILEPGSGTERLWILATAVAGIGGGLAALALARQSDPYRLR